MRIINCTQLNVRTVSDLQVGDWFIFDRTLVRLISEDYMVYVPSTNTLYTIPAKRRSEEVSYILEDNITITYKEGGI